MTQKKKKQQQPVEINKSKHQKFLKVVLLNKQLVKIVGIFFKLHVVGSFESLNGTILKNYSMLYSEVKTKIITPANGQQYLSRNYVFAAQRDVFS